MALSQQSGLEGVALGRLVQEVRDEFWIRPPYEDDEPNRANSLRYVTVEVIGTKSTDERLIIMRELLDGNDRVVLARHSQEVFAHADTPASYLVDVVCEVVWAVLALDPDIRAEDEKRADLVRDTEVH